MLDVRSWKLEVRKQIKKCRDGVGATSSRPPIEERAKATKGITLIALVITIIVLLILAGVTISLTIGERGIFTTAQRAAQNYKDAQEKELAELESFDKELEIATAKFGTIIKTENNIKYTSDGVGNVIPVPVGFTALTGTKSTGFVIKNDTDDNEFVWIPVDNRNNYNRYAFLTTQPEFAKSAKDETTNSVKIRYTTDSSNQYYDYYFHEAMPTSPINQQTSVSTYKGYYIGRYEAGIASATARSSADESADVEAIESASGKPLSQSGKNVYTYVTRDQAKGLAERLYSKASNNVQSTLCSSYAWDTALKFIETNYSTYPTNSVQGNYRDVALSYKDINGNTQNKESGTSTLIPTGQTTAVNNIYDMGGNVWEWTTEVCSSSSNPCVLRGGDYYDSASGNTASGRINLSTTFAGGHHSFRVTLYL